MANATSRLQIQIDAKNNSSAALKAVTNDLKGVDNAAGNLAGGLGGLAKGAGIAGIIALGTAAVGAAFDMSRLAATASDVEASFESMAGAGADQMFAGLKAASRGAINDMDLMLSANRAMLLGVADSTEEMVALMDVARARSQAMGTTTAEAFADLVTGLGRGSAAILDNLGIMLDADTVYQQYAESIGKSVSKLTDQEKKQALVNAVLRESADLVKANEEAGDDAASNFERMDAAITNAKVALGDLFSPAVVAIANSIAEATTKATDAMKEQAAIGAENTLWDKGEAIANAIEAMNDAMTRMQDAGISGDVAGLRDAANHIEILRDMIHALGVEYNAAAKITGAPLIDLAQLDAGTMAFEEAKAAAADLGATVAALGRSFSGAGPYVDAMTEKLGRLKAQSDATASALNAISSAAIGAMHSAASAAVGIMPSTEIARIYGESTKRIQAQQDAMEAAGMTVDEIDFKMQEMAKRASAPFDAAVEGARAAEKAMTATAPAVAQLSEEYTNLQSAVEGVLSGALDPGVGVDPDKLLEAMGFPRADAINENARRLADIAANGLKNQDWLSEFGSEVPDIWRMIRTAQNPQEEAARLLQDFQDGLLTAPIDKAKAKEIVRRQIMGDQNMAAFANEIATELAAEMGIPLQQALAATQGTLGGGSGAIAAATFAESAAAGLDEAGGGAAFVGKFAEQMKASYGLLSTAGRDAGKLWGASFLEVVGDNVPASLIQILTDLVSPQVFAKFAQQGSLTGSAP